MSTAIAYTVKAKEKAYWPYPLTREKNRLSFRAIKLSKLISGVFF